MLDASLEIGVVKGGVHFNRPVQISLCVFVLAVLFGSWAPTAAAQQTQPGRDPDSFINQQRALDERLRREFDAELGDAARALFDWGGWYNAYVFVFDDGVESSRTFRRHDLRLWGRLSLFNGAHELYVRGRLSALDFNSGDAYDRNDDDVEGPNLERGYYRFDLARARRAAGEQPPDYNVVVKAGRDLTQFGAGLALATPLDQVWVQGTYRSFQLTAFAGKTIGSTQDFDLSRTATRSRRNLYGAQVQYVGLERHRPFVYAVRQEDRNRESTLPLLQEFDYDSFYFGIGSTGELAERLRYTAETVYETGKSFGQRGFFADKGIHAWALLTELEYLFPGEHKARASIEYLFASGDGNRLSSPTNTIAGNRGDTEDTSFVGFGYRDTGLSFAPRFSNLHMWRAGASYYPWPDRERFRRLVLGTDWYLFYKNHAAAAVSDPTATHRSGYLGWEMDYYINWRVTSDLAWTARLGVFFPGDAFGSQSTRTFLLAGLTWSF